MKKLFMVVGAGIGFVLGSRAGRGPYEKLDGQVRRFLGRAHLQDRIDQVAGTASEQLGGIADKTSEQISDLASRATDKLPG
jgi:hypothetical protein